MADLFENFDETAKIDPFADRKRGSDGIYRPDIKEAKDPTKGYVATIRFLPNFTRDQKVESSALEKATHYVKLENNPELNGYYDSMNNFGKECILSQAFWNLRKSNSPLEQEKSKLINRSVRYYSYVLIVEDPQNPDLEGKIMIFQYGNKIAAKIKEERMGMYEDPCNVFDLADGKDFLLVIKKVGGFNNYDSSKFLDRSPIKIKGKDGKFKKMPTETSDGKIVIAKNARDKIKDFLLNREHDLEEFGPQEWDAQTHEKVKKIVGIVTGQKQAVQEAKKQAAKAEDPVLDFDDSSAANGADFDLETASTSDEDLDDFFNNM